MIFNLVISLGLTLLLELMVSFLCGVRQKRDVTVVIWANICTNLLVVYTANLLALSQNAALYAVSVLLMEIGVCIAEGFIYRKCLAYKKMSPYLLSVINNAISFGIGLLWNITK